MSGSSAVDLTIIGGGIVGLLAAHVARQKRPDWRILLMEQHLVGHGATGASAGFDLPYEGSPRKRQLAAVSRKFYAELLAASPQLPCFEHPLFLIGSSATLERMASGLPTALNEATVEQGEGLRRVFPGLRWREDQQLLWGGQGMWSDVPGVSAALCDRLKADPRVRLWEGTEVVGVESDEESATVRLSDDREVASRRVLVATGPWLTEGPGGAAARAAKVRRKKVAAMHVDVPPPPGAPILLFLDEDAFLLPTITHRRWLFSFTSQDWDCPVDKGQLRISAEDRAAALATLQRHVPAWVAHCNSGQLFSDAYTADRDPLVAAMPGNPAVVLAGGTCGSGYRLAPGIVLEALALLEVGAAREVAVGATP